MTDPWRSWCGKELGHIRAEHETRFLNHERGLVVCRGVAEVEAESIAYLVTTAAGMHSDSYSVPYVAGWSGGDCEILRATASRVVTVARAITTELGAVAPSQEPRPSDRTSGTAWRQRWTPDAELPGFASHAGPTGSGAPGPPHGQVGPSVG
jgi:hypothetical protein